MLNGVICFLFLILLMILGISFIINIINNKKLNKSLSYLLVNVMNDDLLSKQMIIANSILKNARHVHYRRFAEILSDTINNNNISFCSEDETKVCPLSSNTISLNLQINNFLLKSVFYNALNTIIKQELKHSYYVYLDNAEFNKYLQNIQARLEDYIWHEYSKQWLKYNGINMDIHERKESMKNIYHENKAIEVATVQIFSQSRLLYKDSLKKQKEILSKYKNNTDELLRHVLYIRMGIL